MQFLLAEELARDRIRELHREAAAERKAIRVRVGRAVAAGSLRRAVGRALVAAGTWVAGATVDRSGVHEEG